MDETLLAAVQGGKAWLDRFTRREYRQALEEYEGRFGGAYRSAVRQAGENPGQLAEALLDALEQGWRRERFWNRSARRFDEKRTVIFYLTPMLLELGEGAFAAVLREAWLRRWPKDPYEIVDWQTLQRSFRTTFLGFEVKSRENNQ